MKIALLLLGVFFLWCVALTRIRAEAGMGGLTGPMTPQETLLAFMLVDLTSCVTPPKCTPRTCAQQNITCGPAGDG